MEAGVRGDRYGGVWTGGRVAIASAERPTGNPERQALTPASVTATASR